MKYPSFEKAKTWGVAATTVVGLGAAAWALIRARKQNSAKFAAEHTYAAPELPVQWEEVKQGSMKFPDEIAIVPAAHPDNKKNSELAVISVPPRKSEQDGDLSWQARELVIARKVGNGDWQLGRTGQLLGDLYTDPADTWLDVNAGTITVAMPLGDGKESVSAFVVDTSFGRLQGENTNVNEVVSTAFFNEHYGAALRVPMITEPR
ncbi:MAG TPA: hypothetical protein VD735_02570 [Candidatus Saccharimonadales bacterium]|nr:hypothetical protein [Candidatus Saccharimonadales bacterium]